MVLSVRVFLICLGIVLSFFVVLGGGAAKPVGGAFFLLSAFCFSYLLAFRDLYKFSITELSHFLLLLFLCLSVFQALIKHSIGVDGFKYLRDGAFFILVLFLLALYHGSIINEVVKSKFQGMFVPFIGVLAIIFSASVEYASWSFRDSYMYAILAVIVLPVASHSLLEKISLAIVCLAIINISIGLNQQLGNVAAWTEIGYGDIALSEWRGYRRPWGTFDRSLTYGHFLLLAAILSVFILQSKRLAVLFIFAALLSFNRSVLVASVMLSLMLVYFEKGLLKKIKIGLFVALIGLAALPMVHTVLMSIFDTEFKSNTDRLNDYMAILNTDISTILYGGYMGYVGANAGRFEIGLDFLGGIAHVHSGYLTLLLEVGLFGLLFYIYSVLWWGIRSCRKSDDAFSFPVVLSLMAVFSLSMITHNMQSNIPNNIVFWLLLGVLAGINVKKRKLKSSQLI